MYNNVRLLTLPCEDVMQPLPDPATRDTVRPTVIQSCLLPQYLLPVPLTAESPLTVALMLSRSPLPLPKGVIWFKDSAQTVEQIRTRLECFCAKIQVVTGAWRDACTGCSRGYHTIAVLEN